MNTKVIPQPIQEKLGNLAVACDELSAAIKSPNVSAEVEQAVEADQQGEVAGDNGAAPDATAQAEEERLKAAQAAQAEEERLKADQAAQAAQAAQQNEGAQNVASVEGAPIADQQEAVVDQNAAQQNEVAPIADQQAAVVDQNAAPHEQSAQQGQSVQQEKSVQQEQSVQQEPSAPQESVPSINDDTAIQVDGKTLLYGSIMEAFENMKTNKTQNRNSLPQAKLDEVYDKLKNAKTTVEVQNILREHNFAMGGKTPAQRFVQRVVGGTRKPRMHRRKKTQRKRSKTIKKKNRAGNRK